MTFGEAIEALRMGKRVQRDWWKDMYVIIDDNKIVGLSNDDWSMARWLPMYEDIFALDWKEVE